jgi:SAM-dependent methyltransferase
VLDLGCNEGFFCIEAKKRGAARVVGIDRSAPIIATAQERAAEAGAEVEFRVADMFNLPSERFDYVLLLSALHYIARPAKLLSAIRQILKPNGILILEIGVVPAQNRPSIGRALRAVDESFFSSETLLRDVWLRDYAVRRHGSSVRQKGDPVNRYVFHCRPAKTNVVFIVGNGGVGKTTLASRLGSGPVIATDHLFSPIRDPQGKPRVAPEQKIYDDTLKETKSIWVTWDKIKHDPAIREYFAKVIVRAIQHCEGSGQIIVEGFVATDLMTEVQTKLGADFQCWQTQRVK